MTVVASSDNTKRHMLLPSRTEGKGAEHVLSIDCPPNEESETLVAQLEHCAGDTLAEGSLLLCPIAVPHLDHPKCNSVSFQT